MQSAIGKTMDKVEDITGKKTRAAGDRFFKTVTKEVTGLTSEMVKHISAFSRDFADYKGYARIEEFDEYEAGMRMEYDDCESVYGQMSFSRNNKQEAAVLLKNINGALTRTEGMINNYKNMAVPSSTTFCKELQEHVLPALHTSAKYLNFIADH